MATEVKETWQDLSIADDTQSTAAVRKFDVVFNNTNTAVQNQALVLWLTGIPPGYGQHPFLPWLYVVSRDAKPKNGPKHWGVTINYNSVENPLDVPPKVSYSFASSNEKIDRDKDGVPITNSAKETFDPPITKEVSDLLIKIERNEGFFNELLAAEYKGAINSDVFRTPSGDSFDVGLVRCNEITGSQVFPPSAPAGMNYYIVSYVFQVRWDGWKRRILDEGFREKTGTDEDDKPTYATIDDENGKALSQPSMLDGVGKILASGADPVFIEFELEPVLPFAILGIG